MAVTLSGGTPTFTSGYAGGTVTSGTAVATTSGTSIDFTSIPSWVKRVTVMFNGVSTNGNAIPQIQLGAGSIDTTGYTAMAGLVNTTNNTTRGTTSTAGFIINGTTNVGSDAHYGSIFISLLGSNIWTCSGNVFNNAGNLSSIGGAKTLSGTLDRIRITTANGTDVFDAGSVNILYE